MPSPTGSVTGTVTCCPCKLPFQSLRRLPNQSDLLLKALTSGGLVDSVGISTPDVTVGAEGDFIDMTFSFPSNTDTLEIDFDLGGDVLFDSTDSMTPFSRTWAEWFILPEINVDYLWIGQLGVAGYSTDQSANSAKIISVLRCVAPETSGFPYTFPFTLG